MSAWAEAVESLSPQEQQAVLAFIEYLRNRNPVGDSAEQTSPFAAAAEEFIQQHPELLRRLAQ
jgi:hypothetical protein